MIVVDETRMIQNDTWAKNYLDGMREAELILQLLERSGNGLLTLGVSSAGRDGQRGARPQ
jgi:hypothetical protein